ncbi:MAG TPA: DinB family protein [Chloroflexia bacterium]|nr:DinB family protein [Chloroflexia bacterium]
MSFIIHRKPPYRVFVEEGPSGAMAHVAELPGCFAVGSDASKSVAGVPRAIVAFLAWLRSHREPLVPEALVARPSMADLYVAEVFSEGAPLQAGSRAALFEPDTTAWTDEKLERTLRWLSYSRADLLSQVEGMSEAELKAIRLEEDRTLWDTLLHVANAEYGYVNRIAGPLSEKEGVTPTEPADARQRLALVRNILQRRVTEITPDRRVEVVYAPWAARPDEPWTLQKALRRALEHEREHVFEIGNYTSRTNS